MHTAQKSEKAKVFSKFGVTTNIYVVVELDRKKDISMKSDHLHLNSDKTQFIRVGSRQQLASVSVTKIVLKDSASRHRPSSRVLASRLMTS